MRRDRVFPVLVLLIAAVLRFHALGQAARFHPDEALFSTFARSAALNGDWMLPGALDKPPLSIYVSALFMAMMARDDITPGLPDLTPRMGEFAARFPNVLASLVLVAVTYALGRRLYGRAVGLIAMLVVSLSPYAVAFSATAFTDNFMLLGMVAALWALAARRWGWGGVCLTLAFASKQQALFYVPLLLALGWALEDRVTLRHLSRLFIPVVIGLSLLVLWDAARAQPTGLFALAAQNNDPFRFIRSSEVVPRLITWLDLASPLFSTPALTAVFIMVAVGGVGWRIFKQPPQRGTLIDILLLTFTLAYFLLHWLVGFNLYDRYVLPLLPLLALLSARTLHQIGQGLVQIIRKQEKQRNIKPLLSVTPFLGVTVLCLLLIVPAWNASEGRVIVGGDHGEHESIDALADYLNSRALGAIVYDHWLGWELGYYMGQWTDKRRVYYPTPESLAAGALAQPDPAPRYFVAPKDEPLGRWLAALEAANFTVSPVYETAIFKVYELIPPVAS